MNYVEFVFCVVPTKLVPLAMVFLVSDVIRCYCTLRDLIAISNFIITVWLLEIHVNAPFHLSQSLWLLYLFVFLATTAQEL